YGLTPEQTPKKELSKGIFGRYAYSPDGRYVFHTRNWDENRFTSYSDIFRFDTKERRFHRLSERGRLDEPTVSPDGRWVMAVQNGKGQTNLVKMRADGSGLKQLTHLDDYTQFSGPSWHPEKHLAAVSAWRDGSRDLYLVDPETGALSVLWRDRDQDI